MGKRRKQPRKAPRPFASGEEGRRSYNEQMAEARSHPWVLAAHMAAGPTVMAPADSREAAARYILSDFFAPKKEARCVFEIVPMGWVNQVSGLPPVRVTPYGVPPTEWGLDSDDDEESLGPTTSDDASTNDHTFEDGEPLTVGKLRQFLADHEDLLDSLPIVVGGADFDDPSRRRIGMADAIWTDSCGGLGGRLVIGAMTVGLVSEEA